MKAYLLGTLPPDDASSLEERYFTDLAFLRELEDAEARLIDDYLTGHLRPSERQLFEARYQSVPTLRDKLERARHRRPELTRRFRISPALLASTAAIVILLSSVVLFTTLHRSRQQVTGNNTTPPVIAFNAPRFDLTPNLAKAASTPTQQVTFPSNGHGVELVLHLRTLTEPTLCTAVIRAIGGAGVDTTSPALWKTVEPVRSTGIDRGQTLTLSLRGFSLPPGDYLIDVSAAGELVDRFIFRVLSE